MVKRRACQVKTTKVCSCDRTFKSNENVHLGKKRTEKKRKERKKIKKIKTIDFVRGDLYLFFNGGFYLVVCSAPESVRNRLMFCIFGTVFGLFVCLFFLVVCCLCVFLIDSFAYLHSKGQR